MNDRTFERRRLRVYVAGPISQGDTWENIQRGLRWGRQMLRDGLAPYVPHLDAYLTLAPTDDDAWQPMLEWDLEWVAASEALFRITGPSKGAELEIDVAKLLRIPVWYEEEYDEMLEWADEQHLKGKRVWTP